MTNPRWTLITVTYNNAQILADHWSEARPEGVEWIVIDNASSDGSGDLAERLGADLVIRSNQNLGFGRANNRGFQEARGTFVAFVNPDVTVDYSTLTTFEEYLTNHAGIAAPQLQFPDGSPQPSGRGAPSLRNKVLGRLDPERWASDYYLYAAEHENVTVAWVIGAAVVATRDTFAGLGDDGPWDPAFFVYYEDSDLGLRSWHAGLPVTVLGDARWTHAWARETTRFRLKPWILELRAMWTFYTRYPALVWTGDGGRRYSALRRNWGVSSGTAT